jgi:hypothetical protein
MAQAINHRVATPEDADAGIAIFHIADGRSTPYSFGQELPMKAVIANPNLGDAFPPFGTVVEILQAEQGDTGEIVVGFILGEQEFVGMLEDIKPVEDAE